MLAGLLNPIIPGVASFARGDAAGGALHMYVGAQSLGFFMGVMANIDGRGSWSSDRTALAAATAAAIYTLNYLASIARAGGELDTEGTPSDSMRLRLSISTVAGGRSDEFDDGDGRLEPSLGQSLSIGIMLGPVVEMSALVESLYGDFYPEEDTGLLVSGQFTFHIPTEVAAHPYMGISASYHGDSALFGAHLGLAVELSPRIELFLGARADMSTTHTPALARLMAQFGFTRAF